MWSALAGCASPPQQVEPEPAPQPAALPPEAKAAENELRSALAGARDPKVVSEKARAADAWEGKDRELDLLIADALANVLMRPADATPILARWPASDDPAYHDLVVGKAIRSGDWAALATLLPDAPVDNGAREQLAIRALREPSFSTTDLVRSLEACALLDRQPQLGRRPLDMPVPADTLEALAAWGVKKMAVGRASLEGDPVPERGEDPILCRSKRWLDVTALPERSRPLTLAVSDGTHEVFIEMSSKREGHWAISANDATAAARLIGAAQTYSEAGGGEAGRAAIIAKYGQLE